MDDPLRMTRRARIGGARCAGWVETSFLTETGFALLNILELPRRKRALPADPHSIGILRTGSIGDIILTTGMIRCIRKRYPDTRLHYFCYPAARPIVEGQPGVDRVWSPGWFSTRRLRKLFSLSTLRNMRAFTREAHREKIELLLVPCRQQTLLGALKVALITRMIGPGSSVGWSFRNRAPFLDVRVPDQGLLVKHEADWCADLLQAAGIPGDCRAPSVTVGAEHSAAAAELLRSRGVGPEQRLVIIHPGGGSDASEPQWALKRWPAENFATVARELGRTEKARVAITGLQTERAVLREMARHGLDGALDLVGATDLLQFAALAQRAALVIGNDSGATHLAAAVGAPTIALFGYTDFIGYHPLGPRVTVLRRRTPCSPCLYWFGHPPCGQSYRCLRGISPEEVLSEARRILSTGMKERA